MEEKEKIEQPSLDIQKILDDVMAAESTDVVFLGKKRKIGLAMARCDGLRMW